MAANAGLQDPSLLDSQPLTPPILFSYLWRSSDALCLSCSAMLAREPACVEQGGEETRGFTKSSTSIAGFLNLWAAKSKGKSARTTYTSSAYSKKARSKKQESKKQESVARICRMLCCSLCLNSSTTLVLAASSCDLRPQHHPPIYSTYRYSTSSCCKCFAHVRSRRKKLSCL